MASVSEYQRKGIIQHSPARCKVTGVAFAFLYAKGAVMYVRHGFD